MPKARWRIGLQADPIRVHTAFIWCGLSMLHDAGLVELDFLARNLPVEPAMWLEVEDRETHTSRTICLDLSDNTGFGSPRRAEMADVVWKRSYHPAATPGARPFGMIAAARSGTEARARYLASGAVVAAGSRRFGHLRKLASGILRINGIPLLRELEGPPGGDERVLFQVRSWEPAPGKSKTRAVANEQRADLISLLRSTFGTRFVGGFVPTSHALATYPSLITSLDSSPAAYLELIKSSAVTVSTTGLDGSTPYKVVEYLANSRAIVSERLHYEVPEPLTDVVEFWDDPQHCVDLCGALLDEPDRRNQMQEAARGYWSAYVRPEQLVLRRLEEEFDASGARS